MVKIKNERFRGKRAVIGSFEIEFDPEGVAEAPEEIAAGVAGIKGFAVLSVVAMPPGTEGESVPTASESDIVREPESKRRGRPAKNDN